MYDNISPESLKTQLLQNFAEAGWSTMEGSAADLLAGPVAVELWKRYMQDLAIPSMLYVDEHSGGYIDKAAQVFGIKRKSGSFATAEMTMTGDAAAVIPANTAFLTGDGIEFRLISEATLGSDGEGSGTVKAVQEGEAGNRGAGELRRMYVSLPGLKTWRNGQATGGSDEERDQELVSRFYQYIRSPRTSSNVHDYEQWALSVDEVGFVQVNPLWDGPGTVQVVLAGRNGTAITEDTVIEEVWDVINDPVTGRAIGAEVSILSARELAINISATLILEHGVTIEVVEDALRTAVQDYLKGLIFKSDVVPYNRILALLMSIDGVIDAKGMLVNGKTEDVAIASEGVLIKGETADVTIAVPQIPVLGSINLAVGTVSG